ncbi:cadmium-transporting ATPase [Haloglomus irregulare]|uniref:P-type Cu(+) transporter n=1 Tax=Haloglomus irregulare TaxID=2234134 RepID=A0A554NAZ4_9EURY|nr:heavy metal translocating P-type ATPase [Haloglomus irregulare]TSD14571.1 cadmium-transporting ATPase [Haloglomus irregulare]
MSDRRDAVGGEPTPSESDGGTDAEFTLDVPDMDCASCAEKIAGSVRELAGVRTVETHPTTGQVVVGGRVSREAVVERIVAAGYAVAERTVAFQVPEMNCASCADTVEGALAAVAGVHGIDARPTVGRVEVTVGDGTTVDALRRAVEDAGYPVVGEEVDGQGPDGPAAREPVRRSRRAKLTGVAAVLLAVGLVLEFLVPGSNATVVAGPVTFAVADLLFLGAVATGGAAILRNGYYSARNRSLDIDFLMSAAIVSAVVASVVAGTHLYVEAATLSTLFSVAELLERYAMDRTRGSVQELLELAPTEATVRRDGAERTIPAADLVAGDRVVVRPGEKLPADGVVREGESAVNQAPITGESVPVDKTAGDEVYAGTLNESGYLEVDVTAAGGDSTLSKIADLVADADANRTEREQFVERFAAYYTPVMVAVAVLVAAVPPLVLGLDPVAWFVNGITLLVLACPCAFVISTPVSVVSGITAAARNGVLVKGGDHLEAMGGVEAVAVDKTGTLTTGELAVTDIVPLGDHTERDVLRCARGLEARSEHPVGEAIVAHAEGRGAERAAGPVSGFESLTGKGVRATLDGTEHYAGTPALFEELGFDLGHAHVVGDARERVPELRSLCDRQGCLDLAEETIPRLQAEGKTVILVGWEGRGPDGHEVELEGVIAVADTVRETAPWMVERLRDAGLEVVMLTGDNEGTARAVADRVGVDDYRAGLLPAEKADAVAALETEYEGGVAMVGDGVNDAPALAAATVGVAMGAAGTDAAIEAADIALLGDDLTRLPYLYDLARAADGVIRSNVYASLAVKAVLAVGVPFGVVGVAAAVLVGDAGMTLGVTGNAMRLSRLTPGTPADG